MQMQLLQVQVLLSLHLHHSMTGRNLASACADTRIPTSIAAIGNFPLKALPRSLVLLSFAEHPAIFC
jgi:hypothetical protein